MFLMRTEKKPEPRSIDVFVGNRVRQLRLDKGCTGRELAKRIGVAYQQVQKYESAANRISASRLYLICEALDTTIPEFFAEFYSSRRKKGKTMKILEGAEAVRLARLFFKMPEGERKRFYEIGKSLVKEKGRKEGNAKVTDIPVADPKAHPVDVYVGRQIWKFRTITNTTQRELAGKIDIGNQQIQKYEEGTHRVSASKLYLICEALEVGVSEFFEDLYRKRKRKGIMEMIEDGKGARLAGLFFKMPASNRKPFIRLGKNLVEG